jgi:hypothetical protein
MSVPKPRKMVSRNVAIVLGIICIILVAGLGGVTTFYTSVVRDRDSTIAGKDNQISSLDSQIASLNASLNSQMSEENNTISSLNYQISRMNSTLWAFQAQVASLTSNLTNLQKIANLMESSVLFDYGINFTSLNLNLTAMLLVFFNVVASPMGINLESPATHIDYAGYFVVNVTSSTSNTTYIEWNYTSNGFSYGDTLAIGTTGLAYFPILPTTSLIITIGNTDTTILDIQRVTMTYYY